MHVIVGDPLPYSTYREATEKQISSRHNLIKSGISLYINKNKLG